jgi:multidrug efflux pump subunit AcrB
MLFLGVTMMGYFSWKNLSMELFPNAELPQLYVLISCRQDVDPKYMEDQAIIPLEGAIGTLGGIQDMQSSAQSRRGTIQVQFDKSVNFKYVYLKLQEKVNEIKSSVPTDFTITVQKIDQTQMNNQFMQLLVTGSGGADRVRNITDLNIQPELQNIDGIAGVNVYGGRQKSIEVQLNMDICKAYNITAASIRNKISQNYKTRSFAGYVYDSNLEYFVQVSSEYSDLKEIENLVVANGPILLKDVAKVYFGTKDQTSYSRVNGKDAVSITLVNDAQSNLIDLSHKTLAIIEKINKNLADKDIQISVQSNTADVMEKNLHQIGELALVGALLAILFFGSFLKTFGLSPSSPLRFQYPSSQLLISSMPLISPSIA